MSETVYRVQDKEGRGPFRPGFSHRWFEDDRDHYPLAYLEWFGDVRPFLREGEWVGSGCRSIDQLTRWFRKSELETLRLFGYSVVRLDVDRIIAENDTEVVFGRRRSPRLGAVEVEA